MHEASMKTIFAVASIMALFLIVSANVSPSKAAEQTTVQAFATWQSEGRVYRVGEDKGLFVGGLMGIMFVENGKGALNTAKIVCPAMIEISFKDDRVAGDGRCIITGAKGNTVFGKWRCSGIALYGCKGQFDLTAGTGMFEGVTGSGPIVFRMAIAQFARKSTEKSATGIGLGMTAWPRLTYRLKSKQ
jgi:hypothetical protein